MDVRCSTADVVGNVDVAGNFNVAGSSTEVRCSTADVVGTFDVVGNFNVAGNFVVAGSSTQVRCKFEDNRYRFDANSEQLRRKIRRTNRCEIDAKSKHIYIYLSTHGPVSPGPHWPMGPGPGPMGRGEAVAEHSKYR